MALELDLSGSAAPTKETGPRPLTSEWIVSPAFDLVFFLAPWVPLLLAAWAHLWRLSAAAALLPWIFHLALRLPHFAATAPASWLRPDLRGWLSRQPLHHGVIPAALCVLYTVIFSQPAASRPPWAEILSLLAYAWGIQHVGAQNYGLLQIYHLRSSSPRSSMERQLERAVCLGVVAWLVLDQVLDPVLTPWLAGAVGVAMAVRAALALRSGQLLRPAFLFFALSMAVMVRWPFYDRMPQGTWFMVFNGQHSLAYLGLVFRVRAGPGAAGPWLGRFARFYLPLFSVAAAGAALIAVLAPPTPGRPWAPFELGMGFFVAHYYLESRIWRLRVPALRASLLRALEPTGENRCREV